MMLPKKTLPPPSLALVSRPEQDGEYVHFEHAIDAPFDPTSIGFSPVNAWWLADSSLLSYWDPAVAQQRFRDMARLQSLPVARRGTHCYVAWSDDFALVAFRGTESDSVVDFLTNALVPLAAWDVPGERVHSGFRDALEDVWQPLVTVLKTLGTRPVWMTGHSLGGALATLAGDRFACQRDREGFGELRGIYTCGSPLVGDRPFVEGFNQRCGTRSFRFVNDRDLVTRVPPPLLGYQHVTHERMLGADDPDILLREPLIDHTPRRYAVLVWNALVDASAGSPVG